MSKNIVQKRDGLVPAFLPPGQDQGPGVVHCLGSEATIQGSEGFCYASATVNRAASPRANIFDRDRPFQDFLHQSLGDIQAHAHMILPFVAYKGVEDPLHRLQADSPAIDGQPFRSSGLPRQTGTAPARPGGLPPALFGSVPGHLAQGNPQDGDMGCNSPRIRRIARMVSRRGAEMEAGEGESW